MRPNQIDERERQWQEAKREFREGCYAAWRRRTRMIAIQIEDELMNRAIELNPASLVVIAVDPETGASVMRRPYAASGGKTVLLEVGKNLDMYAVVKQ